jgi:hypothetical protein
LSQKEKNVSPTIQKELLTFQNYLNGKEKMILEEKISILEEKWGNTPLHHRLQKCSEKSLGQKHPAPNPLVFNFKTRWPGQKWRLISDCRELNMKSQTKNF